MYLDDIFVFSNTLEEHERHLRLVLDALMKVEFYLKHEKCDLYTEKLDFLVHMIDECGVHADTDKIVQAKTCWKRTKCC